MAILFEEKGFLNGNTFAEFMGRKSTMAFVVWKDLIDDHLRRNWNRSAISAWQISFKSHDASGIFKNNYNFWALIVRLLFSYGR